MRDVDEGNVCPIDAGTPQSVPRYRVVLARILSVIGGLIAGVGFFVNHEPARINVWTASLAFFIWGLLVRFQGRKLGGRKSRSKG
jgi:hypothetical protein